MNILLGNVVSKDVLESFRNLLQDGDSHPQRNKWDLDIL